MLDIGAIRGLLPHRYPMLLVDRLLELEPGQRAVAIKNVTINEPFFTGHYPQLPVMPGVLIIEAMAQTSGLAFHNEVPQGVPLLAGIDKARFRKQVTPGDQLRIEVKVLRKGQKLSKVWAQATVAGEVAAEAEMLFSWAPTSATSADSFREGVEPPNPGFTGGGGN
jgi:3-hydroxyacyl-[acyl-carrier-protein] dehydratase